MNTTRKLSIIIPCFNEAATIKEIIKRVVAVPLVGWDKEIVIVDDMSTDGTRDILQNIFQGYETSHTVVYHASNQGKGSAVTTGLAHATGDYMLIQDADLEYDPAEIPKLMQALAIGTDTTGYTSHTVVYGSRNIEIHDRKMMLIPRIGVWFITLEFNILFGTHLTDLWTCYKLFPKSASQYFTAGRFESELSFTAKLIKNNFSIIEVPISHKPRSFEQGKKIRYSDGIRGIVTIFTERFR